MIEHLPFSERPRERCLTWGAESLSLRECFALILGSGPRGKGCLGLAGDILRVQGEHLPGDEERFLYQWLAVGPALLDAVSGLGEAQKARLLACFEIAKRLGRLTAATTVIPETLNLTTLEAKALARVSQRERDDAQEWFGFVGVFKTGRVTELQIIARGSKDHVAIDKQKLFLKVLLSGAPGFILLHNHPSGDPNPSTQDRELTDTIAGVAADLNLTCVSHLILAHQKVQRLSV